MEAEYDAVTNLRNRSSYEKTCAKLAKSTVPLAAMILDVDHFKQVNDNYGHIVGDLTLQKVAKLLNESFRADDMVFRIGGDEFAVIMLDITAANANVIRDKVNAINEAIGTPDENGVPAFSVSAGCAFSPAGLPEDLMRRADAALYEKKHTSEVGFAPADENHE
jgi:diguanylate cyclase (GGDEF)-like protein